MEPRIRVSGDPALGGRILLLPPREAAATCGCCPEEACASGRASSRRCSGSSSRRPGLFPEGEEIPLEGPVAIVDSISPPSDSYRKHVVHVIFAADVTALARGRRVPGRRRTGPPRLPHARARRDSRCIRRSTASCSAGSRETRRRTSARCGRPDRRASGDRRASEPVPPRRGTQRPRARPSSGASAGGAPPVACASACASSQSASHGFRGRSGPCRYVPTARPSRQPSKPDRPSFPKPCTTRPSGSAPGSRTVRPAWFSKPASCRFAPARARSRAGRRRSSARRRRPSRARRGRLRA